MLCSVRMPKLILNHFQGKAADVSKIHFAVKSWEQNHKKRLPVLYGTWLKEVTNYAIYSDVKGTPLIKFYVFNVNETCF